MDKWAVLRQRTTLQREAGRQAPTFIPLPVFRFTGPTSPHGRSGSLGNINIVQCDHNSSRRNTLTTLFLATPPNTTRKKLAKSPSGTPSERSLEETSEDQAAASDILLRKEALLTSGSLSPKRKRPEHDVITSRDEKLLSDVMSRGNPRGKSIRSNHSNGESVDNRIMIAPRMIDDGELNSHELDFLHFSADGDIEGLRNLFVEQGYYLFHLDVNCVDSLDRTALSLATINNHVDVVKFIVNEVEGVAMGDALFYAIQSEYIETIELLLEKDPQTSIQVMPGTTSPFEPGLTPFMMAAHKNNYKILALLYKYSHRLTFSENEFILDEGFDPYSWDAVMERLLHYKARASPSFMLLMFNEKGMSWDPLNASMDLFNELHQLAQREREVEEAYCSMADGCETFALQLLQEVRSASELADLMQYDLDDDVQDSDSEDLNEDDHVTSERRQKSKHYLKPIEKAVKFEMKDFVTSDNSQLALIYIQKGKLFRRLKGIKATVTQLFLGLLFPFLSLGLILAPQSAVGRVMGNPTVKFWCWVVSEIVFIIMLLANTILMQYDVLEGSDGISPLLAIAYFWIVGKFFQEAREIYHQGLREYLSDIWNWNDMCTIVLYTLYMLLRVIHIIQNPGGSRGNNYFWQGNMWDPLPLSDICIAVSYILIHMRIMELLRAERTFGPLQVSLDLMLHDAFRFSVIFCIVFLAFGSGITELYTPYARNKHCTCNETSTCNTSLPLASKWIVPEDNTTLPACVSCKDGWCYYWPVSLRCDHSACQHAYRYDEQQFPENTRRL
uniref:Short transient receptor potential channel 4-like n=1 Tax=Phallusia mammillata TaxID=59560 RepID=A0A6F9DWA1_9ASCI|nr:short transient receptor potential channel 4-like [Phallusia mammillata]